MSVEENKATILHMWEELNQGNLTVLDECFADNFVRYAHDGKTMDKQGYRNFCAMIIKNMPDFNVTIDDIVAEKNKVAFRMTITGTFNGKRSITKETYFARFEGNKVVEYVNLNRQLD
jgi:predicted ester cyclase